MKKYLKKNKDINEKEYFNSYFPNRCFICKNEINLLTDINIRKYHGYIFPSCSKCKNKEKIVIKKKIERFLYSNLKYNLKKDIGYLRTIPKDKRAYRIDSLIKRKFKDQNPPNWWINRETSKVCKYLNKIESL